MLERKFLRLILQAHGKSPGEILYLETSALEIKHFIAVRKLAYLQTILKRQNEDHHIKDLQNTKEIPIKR